MKTYTWTTEKGGKVEIDIEGTTKKDRAVKRFTANGTVYTAKLDWINGKHAVAFTVGTKTGYAIIPDDLVTEIFAAEIKAETELKEYCKGYDNTIKAMSY